MNPYVKETTPPIELTIDTVRELTRAADLILSVMESEYNMAQGFALAGMIEPSKKLLTYVNWLDQSLAALYRLGHMSLAQRWQDPDNEPTYAEFQVSEERFNNFRKAARKKQQTPPPQSNPSYQ